MFCLSDIRCYSEFQFHQSIRHLELDEMMMKQLKNELGIPSIVKIEVYEAKDMPCRIRGQVEPSGIRSFVIYLNPADNPGALDDTVLHEMRHIYQILNGYVNTMSENELERDAQSWAEEQLRRGKYRGILRW